MPNNQESTRMRALAQDLLQNGSIGSTLVVTQGYIGTPVAVQSPAGGLHSWFVPVILGSQLAGFFQFLPDRTLMRYASFQRKPADLTGCPPAADWLDLAQIQNRAEGQRQPGETSSQPFLTYDKTPDRLVWAVPLIGASGAVRLVYVVGKTVYTPSPGETYG